MPLLGQGNYILHGVSGGHLVQWAQISNNPTPSFDYSGGVANFTIVKFPPNTSTLLVATFELTGDPATQALSSTIVLQNSAGSPVARTSTFTPAITGTNPTVDTRECSIPYVFDATFDNTGLEFVVTLGTGVTLQAAALSLLSLN